MTDRWGFSTNAGQFRTSTRSARAERFKGEIAMPAAPLPAPARESATVLIGRTEEWRDVVPVIGLTASAGLESGTRGTRHAFRGVATFACGQLQSRS